MAITSTGYERAVSYAEFGELLSHAGSTYGVFGAGSFAASAGVGTRAVAIAAGRASGWGILDESDAVETVAGASVSSGSRWDLIVLRRDWDTKTSSVVLIPGSATLAIPARSVTPGDEDDQPLALVRFQSGQTAVQEIIDLRVWQSDGGATARHLMVRDYLTRIGAQVWIEGALWLRGFNSSGVPTWVSVVSASHVHSEAKIDSVVADVDGAASNTSAGKLIRWGASGSIGVPDPTSNSHPAHKKYVDDKFNNVPTIRILSSVNESAAPDDFQQGVTIAQIGSGFPIATGEVVTVRYSNARAYQEVVAKGTSQRWWRGVNSDGSDWADWNRVAVAGENGVPLATATGRTNVSTGFPTVTLPGSRFTKAPVITAQLESGAGYDLATTVMVTNVTTSSFQCRHTGDSGSRTVAWQAVQMSSGSAEG